MVLRCGFPVCLSLLLLHSSPGRALFRRNALHADDRPLPTGREGVPSSSRHQWRCCAESAGLGIFGEVSGVGWSPWCGQDKLHCGRRSIKPLCVVSGIAIIIQQSLDHLATSKTLEQNRSKPNSHTSSSFPSLASRPLRFPPSAQANIAFNPLQHLSTSYHQTPLLHNSQHSLPSKWSTIASPPQTPPTLSTTSVSQARKLTASDRQPRSRTEGFGFAMIATTSTIIIYALTDVALVLISGAHLAPTAEEELGRVSGRDLQG